MADIKITELRPLGSELFEDDESFLNELNDQDLSVVGGGGGDGTAGSVSASVQTEVSLVSQASLSASGITG